MTAFPGGGPHAVHLLNMGGAGAAAIEGLPDADWKIVESTEASQYQARPAERGSDEAGVAGSIAVTLVAEGASTAPAAGN